MPSKSQASRKPSTLPPSASPPTALLWAHQLRRENNALVERIHALEKSVKAAVDGVEGEKRKIGKEREKREKGDKEVVGKLTALIGGVGEVLEGLESWKEEVERREREREEVVEGLRREIGELKEGIGMCSVMSLLFLLYAFVVAVGEERCESNILTFLGASRRSKRSCHRTLTSSGEGMETSPLVAGTQQRFESIELGDPPPRECPVPEGQDVIVRDSMATETPSDMSPEIPESQPDDQLLVETQIRPEREVSGNRHSTMDLDEACFQASHPQQESREPLSIQLVQGSLSVVEYLQLGEDMRARFPGRRQEGRVVEAFWEGMNDGEVKRGLEEELEKDGWVWGVVREVCGRDTSGRIGGSNQCKGKVNEVEVANRAVVENPPIGLNGFGKEKRSGKEESVVETRKVKKRRFIPVAPVDEDENFL